MGIRIIDNKKVELTEDEYNMYKQICRGYDRAHFKGEELFKDHFEVDDEGIIIFVKPPTKKFSSMEVFCFLLSIMQNQHIRNWYKVINQHLIPKAKENLDQIINDFNDKLIKIDDKIKKIDELENNLNKPKKKSKTKKKTSKKKTKK